MRVLYVSKMDIASANLFEYLQQEFDVQMCDCSSGAIRRMIKIIKPDLIFVTHDESYDDMVYLNLEEDAGKTPIIVLCDEEDEFYKKKKCASIDYIHRPIKPAEILEEIHRKYILQSSVEEDLEGEIDEATEEVTVESCQTIKRKILAIDDDAQILRVIKSILKDEYDVALAPTAAAGLWRVEESDFDLILLDFEMPVTSGLELLKILREAPKTRNTPVVFLTSVADRERVAEVAKYKPEGYLLKPIDVKELMSTINDMTTMYRL